MKGLKSAIMGVIKTTYDGAERANAVSGTLGTQQTNYVGSVQYWPHGAPYYYQYGNNVWPVNTFDSVLRPNQTYSTVGNNPNYWLLYIINAWNTNGTLGSLSEGYGPAVTWSNMTWYAGSFGYDHVNRLTSATDTGWSRAFSYDQYGNMSVTSSSNVPLNGLTPQILQAPYNPYHANNQLVAASYDAAGNMGTVGALSFWYDAEGRQTQSYDAGSHTTVLYTYDADGQRVQKAVSNGLTTVYIHDAFEKLAAEYASSAPTPPCTTCYLSYDHLGSVRLITDQNANVISRHDYLPFGEEIPNGSGGRSGNGFDAASNVNQMFTGKERDGEMVPNMDYFGARYYGGVLGRWATPDRVNLTDDRLKSPSSTINKYIYGGNNPVKFVDPDGNDITVFYEAGNPLPGHMMMLAHNQDTGATAVRSFGPNHDFASRAKTFLGLPVSATDGFGLGNIKSADDLRRNYSSITIQTSPEIAQQAIDEIISHPDGNYTTYWNNCTTTCAKVLRDIQLLQGGLTGDHPLVPEGMMNLLYDKYGNGEATEGFWRRSFQNGTDYGHRRSGYDPFQLLFLTVNCTKTTTTWTENGKVTSVSTQYSCPQ